ncbi:MAG: biopolymer transporter ExbD [Candidatus Eremiobacteraeota bacterium]|nr:biopolymer transporter ExbD [Candidatus Eremiobacteraeota bacterium]MCW5870707.1 biopolymer transporter ExbD [Candidatus Eremiobacteraeota bacterium]
MPKLFPARKKKRTPRIEIIPMVDVMFLLLVFYILSSLALKHPMGIPVNLPAADSSESGAAHQPIVLTVTRDGRYYLNKDVIKLPDLAGGIEALPGGLAAARKTNIVLNADLTSQHRYVVAALDELRKLGLNDFLIATEEK